MLRQTQLLGFLGRSTAEGKCCVWLGVSANTKAWSLNSVQSNFFLFSGACTWLNSLLPCTEMLFNLELFKLNTKTTQGKRKGRRFLLRMYGGVSTFALVGLSGTNTSLPSCRRSCPRLGQWPHQQDMVSVGSGSRVSGIYWGMIASCFK